MFSTFPVKRASPVLHSTQRPRLCAASRSDQSPAQLQPVTEPFHPPGSVGIPHPDRRERIHHGFAAWPLTDLPSTHQLRGTGSSILVMLETTRRRYLPLTIIIRGARSEHFSRLVSTV